jgi:hypothetical protein
MINLDFLTEGKSFCYIRHTFLLGLPTGWSFTTQQATVFLAPLPRKSGRPLQGEFFARTSFTLFYCFALLYLFYLPRFISKTQKN